jgi:uncharacterized protein
MAGVAAMNPLLMIFTRLPAAGRTKTRLMPALGAEGAAELQRQMTLHTVRCARRAARDGGLDVQIHHAGGQGEDFRGWLGPDLNYRTQSEGDLGQRMAQAFAAAFQAGRPAAVLIGCDCPQLDENLLRRAFQELAEGNLVLGPALDGGYYLIGLRQDCPELFQGMAWGTDRVRADTLRIAASKGLTVKLLEPLSDVDRPEDLPVWHAVQAAGQALRGASELISVIIPTLNEAQRIGETLSRVLDEPGVEAIVVDGGSSDGTCELARSQGALVVASAPGRGRQMNAGARVARGELLLFLHADTLLPAGYAKAIRAAMGRADAIAGAFRMRLDVRSPGLRLVELLTNLRCRLFQEPYGDQALFLRAATFRELGGFPETPILEDVMLVRHLKRRGRIVLSPLAALTSARRWQRLGIVKTTLLHRAVMLAHACGAGPEIIVAWLCRAGYYGCRREARCAARSGAPSESKSIQ